MKEFARPFYKSAKWRKCRNAYIDYRRLIDGGYCEVCHEQLGYIVHHKIPLTPDNINDDSISLSFDNLRYDCKDCHDREDVHPFISGAKVKCFFDDKGNPLPRGVKNEDYFKK